MTEDALPDFQLISDKVLDAFPAPMRTYVRNLHTVIQRQQAQIELLQARVTELEARLAKNSANSSKPPSSDGLKRKPKSQRGKSGKKAGAQQGHVGYGRSQVKEPDVVVNHVPASCDTCGFKLAQVNGACVETRQVFDIPDPRVEVTEHRVEKKLCPCCGAQNRGVFPEEVKGPVQFGARVQSLATYFSHQHFIPVKRICEIFEAIFGVSISPGACSNYSEKLFSQLDVFEKALKTALLGAPVLHFDETGIRCEKKLHWVHVASSEAATLYTIHTKRGQEGMNNAGVLPDFKGIGIHDHWLCYFSYTQMLHGLCNAHHLRELTFIHEEKKEEWSQKMKELLLFANQEVEKYRQQRHLPPKIIRQVEKTYAKIMDEGAAYHESLPPLPKAKRGRQKQREGKNLLDRLREKSECVLRFIHDFSVPFTNNQGEQDIRMVKLKQKISGCFRAFTGGEIFCRIRSYLSTARKQGWNIWDALSEAIKGSPRLLPGRNRAELSAA